MDLARNGVYKLKPFEKGVSSALRRAENFNQYYYI